MRGYALLTVVYILGTSIITGQHIGLQVDGLVGIGTDNPQTELHIVGDVTTPWGITWFQYQADFMEEHRFKPWLKRAWSSSTGDYLYLSGVGNRSNIEQTAIFLSEKKGFIVGRGSDDAIEIEDEYLRIDTSGSIIIDALKGNSTRKLTVSADGTISTQKIQKSINYGVYSFISDDSEEEFVRANYGLEVSGEGQSYTFCVPITLPEGSIIDSIVYYFSDNCSNSQLTFQIQVEQLGTHFAVVPVATYATGIDAKPGYNKSMSIAVNLMLEPNSAYRIEARGTNYNSCDMWINGARLLYTLSD